MNKYLMFLVSIFFLSCATTPPQPQGHWEWRNDDLYSQVSEGELTQSELENIFKTTGNKCTMEALKIPIPSPSCTQQFPYPIGNVWIYPRPSCNYTMINKAWDDRRNFRDLCMENEGWRKIWKSGE